MLGSHDVKLLLTLTCPDFVGFRCDVAAEVPTDFWEQARAEIDKVKPDILMLAESDKPELLVHAFDLDYSWPLLGRRRYSRSG